MSLESPRALTLLSEFGTQLVSADSGLGNLFRPFARGEPAERTAGLEGLWDFFINDVPDPDEAMRLDPQFHTRMRQHPAVSAAMRKREDTVASMPEHIEANQDAPDKELAKTVADYVQWRWNMLPNRRKMYQWLDQAVLVGGAGGEPVWHRDADGTEWPAKFCPLHKSRFARDRLGNMALKTRQWPIWGMYIRPNPQDQQNLVKKWISGKFIYHTYREEPGYWEQPELEGYIYWGVGEDVGLYYPVTFDDFAWRMHMKLLQKYGMPPTLVYWPENLPQYLPRAKQIGQSLRGETVISVPRLMGDNTTFDSLFKIEQLPVPTMSFDIFERFHRLTREYIDNTLLGSAEENQAAKGDGFSAHVSRREGGPMVKYGIDAQNISETITTQIIPSICLSRWPMLPSVYFPKHHMSPKEERDYKLETERATEASKIIPLDRDEVYERLGWKKPKEGVDTVYFGQGGFDDGFELRPPLQPPAKGVSREKVPVEKREPMGENDSQSVALTEG